MELTSLQKQAAGLDASHLCEVEDKDKCFLLHSDCVDALRQLQSDATQVGYDLRIVSAYRDFHRQLSIWNAKATGKRILLDSLGQPLDYITLTEQEKLFAILRWSALPGLSRHHWGCDFDVYDANRIGFDNVKLVPEEVEGDGPCAPMHKWLSEKIANNTSCSFYRPYHKDTGGVAPELWHLSYLPVAKTYLHQLNPDLMTDLWSENGLMLLNEVKSNILHIWSRYVQLDATCQPFWVTQNLL